MSVVDYWNQTLPTAVAWSQLGAYVLLGSLSSAMGWVLRGVRDKGRNRGR